MAPRPWLCSSFCAPALALVVACDGGSSLNPPTGLDAAPPTEDATAPQTEAGGSFDEDSGSSADAGIPVFHATDSGPVGWWDAALPDGSCNLPPDLLIPDGADDASTCTNGVSPADLACDASSDCKPFVPVDCCGGDTYAVNVQANPCKEVCELPPGASCSPRYVTEDCRSASSLDDITIACVDHTCLSLGPSSMKRVPPAPGSENAP